MEVKKCDRCGGFHLTENSICANCLDKEMMEVQAIKQEFDGLERVNYDDILTASKNTNISGERIERYLDTYLKM